MIRFLLVAVLLFNFQTFANETPIKLGVRYNEATARIEAFKDVQQKIEREFYKKYLKDLNRKENIEQIKNKNYYIKGRYLCPFYLKETLATYAVVYDEMPKYAFYYNILGNLIKFDITQNSEGYPKKILGYSRYGNLISVAFEVDENEQFVYDDNGKLIAHWVGDEVLNKDDKTFKVFKLRRGK